MIEDVREMSVSQLRKATHFLKIGNKYVPTCAGNEAIRTTYTDLPKDQLVRPKVDIAVIRQCIDANRNPVDPTMLSSLRGIVI